MKILSALLISASIALTSPAIAADYQPPNSGHIKSTKVIDCNRGSDRREGCL